MSNSLDSQPRLSPRFVNPTWTAAPALSFSKALSSTMLRNLLLLLSAAVGETMAVDERFLDLLTNVVVHVEAIIVTTLITTARVYKREDQPLPSKCFGFCGKCIIPRSHCLHSAKAC
jgi:hypothetical protein